MSFDEGSARFEHLLAWMLAFAAAVIVVSCSGRMVAPVNADARGAAIHVRDSVPHDTLLDRPGLVPPNRGR